VVLAAGKLIHYQIVDKPSFEKNFSQNIEVARAQLERMTLLPEA